jgi:pyruvate kinase
MNWGVLPLLCDSETAGADDARTEFACAKALELSYLEPGDTVVVTHGTRAGAGGTDMIKVVRVN